MTEEAKNIHVLLKSGKNRNYIVRELQDSRYANDEEYSLYRSDLIDDLHQTVVEFKDSSFRVKHHLRYVEKY